MKRRSCADCRLMEPVAGQWAGLCPRCADRRAAVTPTTAPAPAEPKPQPPDATVDRLRTYLARMGRQCGPDLWSRIDATRATARAMRGWPATVFIPSGIMPLAISPPGQPLSDDIWSLSAALSGLAAWRPTQGIYRFHPEILDAVWNTPVSGALPAEVLLSLPEWCCYIETPERSWRGKPMFGFFVWLDHDPAFGHILRIAADQEPVLDVAFPLPLWGTLEAGLESWLTDFARYGATMTPDKAEGLREAGREAARDAAPLISLTLYLCARNAEIPGRPENPIRPKPLRTKSGDRIFPADAPTGWDVGWRIGAAIRGARQREHHRPGDGTHASPRPHVRRFHWHSFWIGPKATLATRGDRKLIVKWLAPIPVNVAEGATVVPTVHAVKGTI